MDAGSKSGMTKTSYEGLLGSFLGSRLFTSLKKSKDANKA
jgi:uncharacterized membrane protein YeaQ/YmgE (transglycosylase-associated protein family)